MISLKYFSILIVSLIVYWLIPRQRLRNILLIASSLYFIYSLDKWSVIVVVSLTVISYYFGMFVYKYKKKAWIHALSVALILAILIIFKYLGFLAGVFNSITAFLNVLPAFEIKHLLLPLGISYISFKHISYLTDIKWGLVEPGNFFDFLLYSSLFTIFVAGPIERFERLKPQLETKKIDFAWDHIDYGFMRIVFGMFKKLVLADWIGFLISPIWSSPHEYGHLIRLLALIGYSFQIYFDFAGYSDIAIGSSRLFGLNIMENFNNPYLAPNISQFWRRWHISLSDWIRDYLFFPLSKVSRKKIWQMFFVPVIAMAICGLWHGAAWHFIFWGVWHGIGLSVLQLWNQRKRKNKKLAKAAREKWFQYAAIAMNFSFVTLGWWWFR